MPSVRHLRSVAQLLHRPRGATVASVVRHGLAVQAQDLRSARLALRARTRGTTTADVDRALTEDRSVLVTWLNRGTLHLVSREDHPWLLGLTAPTLVTAVQRRLDQLGVTPAVADRAVGVIGRALAEHGPLTRHQLGEHLESAGIAAHGQAGIHLLYLTGIRGITIRGPVADDLQRYALARDWLELPADPPAALRGEDRDRALAELARRYLRGHGPAGDRDLATWAGLPLRDARAGLAAIARELEEVPGTDLVALRPRPGDPPAPARIPVRLLPAWDEMLVGWRDRSLLVPERDREAYTGGTSPNGMLPAIACAGGRAIGRWSIRRTRTTVAIAITPFAPPSAATAAALRREAADVARFERRRLATDASPLGVPT